MRPNCTWVLALRLACFFWGGGYGLEFSRFCAFAHKARDIFEAADAAGRNGFWAVAIRGRQQFASVVVAYLQVASDDGWLKSAVRNTFYKVITCSGVQVFARLPGTLWRRARHQRRKERNIPIGRLALYITLPCGLCL